MIPHRCLDRGNCGEVFLGYNDENATAHLCPYCGEAAEVIDANLVAQ